MADTSNKIAAGLRQAINYAKGEPEEGTRESWYDPQLGRWRYRTFKEGKWVEHETQ